MRIIYIDDDGKFAMDRHEDAENKQGVPEHRAGDKNPPEGRTGREGQHIILPRPRMGYRDATVKEHLQKINEGLDELKDAILTWMELGMPASAADGEIPDGELESIADEAADVIVALTTLQSSMGIGFDARQEAMWRANKRNADRGRL